MKLAPALEATHSSNHRSQLMRQRARSACLLLIPMLLVLAGVAGWPLSRVAKSLSPRSISVPLAFKPRLAKVIPTAIATIQRLFSFFMILQPS